MLKSSTSGPASIPLHEGVGLKLIKNIPNYNPEKHRWISGDRIYQYLFDKETNEDKKKILQDELDLFKWRNNIFKLKDEKTGISREKRDIMSDYYPNEIGLQRPWIERHSHLPNYSY